MLVFQKVLKAIMQNLQINYPIIRTQLC